MAVNFYGSCTGTSSGKYNFWINVTQNSQSVANNTSNVTVKVCLKRNDGYASSAYNLNESSNTVKLNVGGSQKVSKNIGIDTRNGVTVILASWTGNVSHNSDGELVLPVSAEFTMGNSSLSGGSVSGSFKCTRIARASTGSFSTSSVNPGGEVSVTISMASDKFKHKLVWSLGTKSDSLSLGAGLTKGKITIPVDWVNQVTTSKTGQITVTLVTYNGTQQVGSKQYVIKLVIPVAAEYKPDFDVAITRVNNGAPDSWEEFVKGVSRVTVTADNISYKFGASYSAVSVSVGTVKKNSVPATFDITASGSVKVTITLKDSRGMTTTKTENITVNEYSPPSVVVHNLYRCNSEGVAENNGTYLLFDYNVGYSPVNGKNSYRLMVSYKSSGEMDYSAPIEITDRPAVIGDGNIAFSSSYSVKITVVDDVNTDGIETVRQISGSEIPFNIRRGGKGAAFGSYAENDNELYVKWDMKVDGNLNLGGLLSCEELVCEGTDLASISIADVRYFPSLGMVFLHLRLQTTVKLDAGITHYIARIPGKAPLFFTPVSSLAVFAGGGQSTSGVYAKTGEVVLRSDVAIESGSMVFVNGCYFVSD